jgi:hypothetical protein
VEGTDHPDAPPQQQQQQPEKAETVPAQPGATAGSSTQDAPLIEEAVQEGGAGHDDGGAAAEEEGQGTCDLYQGQWVYDEARAPIYKESSCSFLTEQVTCTRNGRRDDDYQKWRWQPDGCDLPRYAASPPAPPCFLACLPLHCISFAFPFPLSTAAVYVYLYTYTCTYIRPARRA